MKRRVLGAVAVLVLGVGTGLTQSPSAGLAQTPPMGWNSWNHFAKNVTQKDIEAAADALVTSGMRDAGYVYVNIDDTWEGERDSSGVLHSNSKFPDMKGLSEYVHSRGLKLGIYSGPGALTCGKFPASGGFEEQDAKLYASWGVDYLKYDLCSFSKEMSAAASAHPEDPQAANRLMREAYMKMRRALDATGRPIVFSLCQYGWDHVWTWGPSVGGNLWRTTDDISDNWWRMTAIGFSQAGLAKYAGPGHWNDPDMLEVGNGKMNTEEYRTHMSLWAILAAPLIAGNDLSKMTAETKSILLNRGVIAIDQDRLGKQGDRVRADGPFELWTKPLSGGAVAVGLFNRGQDAEMMSFSLSEIRLPKGHRVVNVWTGEEAHPKDGSVSAMVPKHGVALFRVEP